MGMACQGGYQLLTSHAAAKDAVSTIQTFTIEIAIRSASLISSSEIIMMASP